MFLEDRWVKEVTGSGENNSKEANLEPYKWDYFVLYFHLEKANKNSIIWKCPEQIKLVSLLLTN